MIGIEHIYEFLHNFTKTISVLTVIFMATCNSVNGQSETRKQPEKDFVKEYCSCLETYSQKEPEQLLYSATVNCINSFFRNKTKEAEQIVKEKEYDSALSDYEKGKNLGKEIVFNVIEDLIENCELYRKSLIEYKLIIAGQLNISNNSIENIISELRAKENNITDKKELGTFFTILGIIYEFANNKEEALNSYNKALDHDLSTQAKGLRLLLKMGNN